ncbi:MAG TPA: hypothetical protein VMT38_12320 [Terracidiphilus sp.]|nr:hypothetical protein [Terracidiphilus sp.]
MTNPLAAKWLKAAAAALLLTAPVALAAEQPTPQALAGFQAYVARVDARIAKQDKSQDHFLLPMDRARLREGNVVTEQLTPANGLALPGALIHDWRGTAFYPGATAADFDRVLRDFDAYPMSYAPEVIRARALSEQGDRYQVTMRVMQHHILTFVMDGTYDVTFGQLDAQHRYCASRSTKISEISQAGTPQERALKASEEHGFLWRMNTYWNYEEADGGLYIQIESVSLTRSIPTGLGWAIGPFVESVPKESLQFTLQATRNALKK